MTRASGTREETRLQGFAARSLACSRAAHFARPNGELDRRLDPFDLSTRVKVLISSI